MNIRVVCAAVILGTVISTLMSGVGRRNIIKFLNIPISFIVTEVLFCGCVYLYAKLSHTVFSYESIFPDKVSVIVGIYLYLIFSAVSGILLGALESRGISRYMRTLYKGRAFRFAVSAFMVLNVAFAAVCFGLTYTSSQMGLRITEVCPHNFNIAKDKSGEFPDYIELCNTGDSPLKLSDFFLSDKPSDRDKFNFPEVELGAGEYIIIWADSSDAPVDENGEIHANFSLSDGDTVVLSQAGEGIIDAVEIKEIAYNVSYTLLNDKYIEAYGTPGVSNEGCTVYKAATLKSPSFSLQSGFYTDESILLEINAPRGASVYYTTDGSDPTVASNKYTQALTLSDVSDQANRYVNIKNTVADYEDIAVDETPVDKANIIRAIAIDGDGNFSEVVTGTYFVGEAAKEYEGYSVLSIVSEPEGLFGDKGICVTGAEYDDWYNNTDRTGKAPATNFSQHGKQWEREAVIQLWDDSGELVLDQSCGIRVQGNASRGYALKRFSLYAREHYSGSNYFDASLFEGVKTHSVYLRSDKYDIVVHDLLSDRDNTSVQHGIPTVMFLDGEFYCVTYIREKYDDYYFSEYYNVDIEDLVIISDSEAESGEDSDLQLYQDFITYIKENDASDPEVYANICEQMDIQNFIDFMCTNLYMNNIDWSLYKNFKIWRTESTGGEGYADGRWRWCIYDVDAVGWSSDTLKIRGAEIDPFTVKLPYTSHKDHVLTYSEAPIYSSLIKNPEFKKQFVLTYFDLMNTHFSDQYASPTIKKLSLEDNAVWKYFLKERTEFAIDNIVRNLELSGSITQLTVSTENAEGGRVTVNTVTPEISEEGTVMIYASDYELTLTAEPAEGWEFAGWTGGFESEDETVTVTLEEGSTEIRAIFVRAGEES